MLDGVVVHIGKESLINNFRVVKIKQARLVCPYKIIQNNDDARRTG